MSIGISFRVLRIKFRRKRLRPLKSQVPPGFIALGDGSPGSVADAAAFSTGTLSRGGWKDGFKKVTISAACGATGLAVGYFLGGWGGGTLTNATGTALYAN